MRRPAWSDEAPQQPTLTQLAYPPLFASDIQLESNSYWLIGSLSIINHYIPVSNMNERLVTLA